MNSKTVKIIIGILIVVLILVGGLAILKNAGFFDTKNANNQSNLVEEGEVATTMGPALSAEKQ